MINVIFSLWLPSDSPIIDKCSLFSSCWICSGEYFDVQYFFILFITSIHSDIQKCFIDSHPFASHVVIFQMNGMFSLSSNVWISIWLYSSGLMVRFSTLCSSFFHSLFFVMRMMLHVHGTSGMKWDGSEISLTSQSISICTFVRLVPFPRVIHSSRFTSWSTCKFNNFRDSRPRIPEAVNLMSALLALPEGSVTVSLSVPSLSIVVKLFMVAPSIVSCAVHVLLELSVQEATSAVPIDNLFQLILTCLPPKTLTSCKCNEIEGGVVSSISSVQSDPHETSAVFMSNIYDQITVAISDATNDFLISWNLFVQIIIFNCCLYGQIRSPWTWFQGWGGWSLVECRLVNCAYPRTAAVPTCLYIPIQLNQAYFPFSVLVPTLPTIPLLPYWAVNADKRYPQPWPRPHARVTGMSS